MGMNKETQKRLAVLIQWLINEVRQLDELARSMVPGYAPLDSEDMAKLNEASAMSARMMEENDG